MSVNQYVVGTLVEIVGTFTDAITNTLVDPTTVTVLVSVNGAKLATPPTVVRDSTGVYHALVDTTNAPGKYVYRFASVGVAQAAAEKVFRVNRSTI